ncbi:hypothetical protein [Aquabacterium sp. OR-4]|uniref:hypothetical protein n=1 Tax=Aquabacterium sp. OR-4 TaxID=2978127 RepID=UPI0021B3764A|nr:hypothetical protein [Aquabacterium sp. OR-4]MDT7836058.1 hypothetical protein [Aquabacterium sp. OR-4]MDT7839087.1 hypothetical protein [Aquabacterium sp. OR-4]
MTAPRESAHFEAQAKYCADHAQLGFAFAYPRHFVEAVLWAEMDFDHGGDGHALSILRAIDVPGEMRLIRKATQRKLVPFARGANNDILYCLDAVDPETVCCIDLGEPKWHAREADAGDFVAFLNRYRANEGLPPWWPDAEQGHG